MFTKCRLAPAAEGESAMIGFSRACALLGALVAIGFGWVSPGRASPEHVVTIEQ